MRITLTSTKLHWDMMHKESTMKNEPKLEAYREKHLKEVEKIVSCYNDLVQPIIGKEAASITQTDKVHWIELSYGSESFRQNADGYNGFFLMKKLMDSPVTEAILS